MDVILLNVITPIINQFVRRQRTIAKIERSREVNIGSPAYFLQIRLVRVVSADCRSLAHRQAVAASLMLIIGRLVPVALGKYKWFCHI